MAGAKNVLGGTLQPCCMSPRTGFFRNGKCETGPDDFGLHLVCAQMTEEFLEFSFDAGNDLSTPNPDYNFPGLTPENAWCLCVERWKEALEAGVAPPVFLAATHMSALEFVDLEDLVKHAVDAPQ